MRYRTKLLIAAGLLLAMSLSAAAFAYWGVTQSHHFLTRSRIAHEQLERQLQHLGFAPVARFTDPQEWFSLLLFRPRTS